MYSWRIQACTMIGCVLSVPTQVRTLEAPPQGLDKPILTPQATQSGSHSGILVTWDNPAKPNGEIVKFLLERRQVIRSDTAGQNSTLSCIEITLIILSFLASNKTVSLS